MRSLLIASIALFCSGCEFSCQLGGPSESDLEEDIAQSFQDKGVEVEVDCPAPKKGAFDCSATSEGGHSFTIEVEGEGSSYDWESRGVVVGEKAADTIREVFQTKYDLELDSLECPKLAPIDEEMECVGTADGVEIPFAFRPEDDWVEPTGGVVIGEAAENLIADMFEKELGRRPPVDCGWKLRPAKPKSTLTCTARPGGREQTVYVTVKDTAGNVSIQTTPPGR